MKKSVQDFLKKSLQKFPEEHLNFLKNPFLNNSVDDFLKDEPMKASFEEFSDHFLENSLTEIPMEILEYIL